jgi:hypothetical protein
MTDRKPQRRLPREQVANLEKALAALRKPPEGQRFERGKDHLRTIVGQRVELNLLGADGAQTSVFDFSRNRDQLCPATTSLLSTP